MPTLGQPPWPDPRDSVLILACCPALSPHYHPALNPGLWGDGKQAWVTVLSLGSGQGGLPRAGMWVTSAQIQSPFQKLQVLRPLQAVEVA